MDTSIFKMGIMSLTIVVVFGACGTADNGTSDAAGDVSDENAGAAVGSLFAGSDAPSLKVAAAAIKAVEEGPRSACDTVGDGPSGVITTLSIVPGTYGKSDDSVTVEASDGCDQGGEFAGFEVEEHQMTCTDGDGNETTVVMQESAGVFRENLDLDQTEIYGSFNMSFTSDGSTETISDLGCSLTIDRNQQFGGGCEDGEGNAIEPSNDVTCVDNE